MSNLRQFAGRVKRRLLRRLSPPLAEAAVSAGYELLDAVEQPLDGWKETAVATWQHEAFEPVLQAARAGQPRLDFEVAARAIEATGLSAPLVVEVGCGSGYYGEILPLLLKRPLRYIGIDYSSAMTAEANRNYPGQSFITGDACHLPLAAGCCDILLSGTSLMHIADYRSAIAESVRASREWCIFHTVPVMGQRKTQLLRKQAYGEPVVEVIFNKGELEALFVAHGLEIEATFESIPYDVSSVLGETTWTLTYLCRKHQST